MEVIKYNKEDKVLINTLILMIKESADYYDEDIAAYILKKLGKEKLETNQLLIEYNSNHVYGNLLGYVYKYFSENVFNNNENENNVKFSKWKKLVEPYYDNVNLVPNYIIQAKKDSQVISFATYYAIKKPLDWIKNLNNDKINWSVSEKEELIIIKELLTNDSYNNHSQGNINEIETALLLGLINKHKIAIKQKLPKKDNEKHFVTQLLKSNIIINLLSKGELEQIKVLINNDGLKTLFTKINEKSILDLYPSLLNKLMKIKPPEELLKLMCNEEGYFNICSFLSNRYQKAYKVSLLKEGHNKDEYNGSNVNKKALYEEIEYLKDALKTILIEEKTLLMFWNQNLYCKDYNLFQQLINCLPLPEHSPQSINFYKRFNEVSLEKISVLDGKSVSESLTAREWYDIFNYERLDSQIESKAEIKLKRKI